MWGRIRAADAGYELLPTGTDAQTLEGPAPPTPPNPPNPSSVPSTDYPAPTPAQSRTLRRVPAPVPRASWALALVELAERASYYGVGGVFANFVQRPLPPGSTTGAPAGDAAAGIPGALGMGVRVAAGMSTLFTLLAFTSPLVGGALADLRLGKFRTIAIGTAAAGIAHVLSVYAALPSLLVAGTAFVPFLAGLVLLGASTGLIKANIAPLMAEQYTPEDYVASLDDGEKVIFEREATIQKIMAAYYHSINIGAVLAISSTFAEKYVGFWLAFLIPGAIFLAMPVLLYALRPYLVREAPPSSTALVDAYRFVRDRRKNRDVDGVQVDVADDRQDEMEQAGVLLKLFLFFTVYNVADGGLNSLVTSLAGSMTANGLPNDVLVQANPFAIVIAIPVLDRWVYPAMSARGVHFGPIRRIVVGFVLAAAAMTWCALLQLASAWLVLPAPLLTGISECIAVVTALELGYTMSPPGLKSVVTSLFLFMQATGAASVLVFLPLMRDPALVWPFVLIAILVLGAAGIIHRKFGHLDKT